MPSRSSPVATPAAGAAVGVSKEGPPVRAALPLRVADEREDALPVALLPALSVVVDMMVLASRMVTVNLLVGVSQVRGGRNRPGSPRGGGGSSLLEDVVVAAAGPRLRSCGVVGLTGGGARLSKAFGARHDHGVVRAAGGSHQPLITALAAAALPGAAGAAAAWDSF